MTDGRVVEGEGNVVRPVFYGINEFFADDVAKFQYVALSLLICRDIISASRMPWF